MIDPKELEERTVRAVRGAGRHWESLDAQTQAMLVEVANELLRSPLRAVKSLEQTVETQSQALAAKAVRLQELTVQLGVASTLSSEAMACLMAPTDGEGKALGVWDALSAMVPRVRRWLAATQRMRGPA